MRCASCCRSTRTVEQLQSVTFINICSKAACYSLLLLTTTALHAATQPNADYYVLLTLQVSAGACLSAQDVTVATPGGGRVLAQGVSFELPPQGRLLVVGDSGAGTVDSPVTCTTYTAHLLHCYSSIAQSRTAQVGANCASQHTLCNTAAMQLDRLLV
jgi:hypothetical protein